MSHQARFRISTRSQQFNEAGQVSQETATLEPVRDPDVPTQVHGHLQLVSNSGSLDLPEGHFDVTIVPAAGS